MTYRLMAEWATDLACKKLDVTGKKCETAHLPLPGSEKSEHEIEEADAHRVKKHIINLPTEQLAAEGRHGTLAEDIKFDTNDDEAMVCECEEVSVGEVNFAINKLHVHNLINLRRRTRMGMGTCQGQLCACRSAGLLDKAHNCAEKSLGDLCGFINERWKGMYPVGWGDTVSEIQFTSWLYAGVAGLDEWITTNGDSAPLQ